VLWARCAPAAQRDSCALHVGSKPNNLASTSLFSTSSLVSSRQTCACVASVHRKTLCALGMLAAFLVRVVSKILSLLNPYAPFTTARSVRPLEALWCCGHYNLKGPVKSVIPKPQKACLCPSRFRTAKRAQSRGLEQSLGSSASDGPSRPPRKPVVQPMR
jgi:hypothetical protein